MLLQSRSGRIVGKRTLYHGRDRCRPCLTACQHEAGSRIEERADAYSECLGWDVVRLTLKQVCILLSALLG
jgi:hypothetical protein